jgi:DNA transformation protein and related proteins
MADRHRQSAFADFVLEQMAEVPDVSKRAMFGGFGIYRGGLMFALIAQEQLYFKASDFLAEEFIALGLPPFVYASKGRSTALKYYQAPESVFEDSEQMTLWAQKSYQCAMRTAKSKAVPKIRRSML